MARACRVQKRPVTILSPAARPPCSLLNAALPVREQRVAICCRSEALWGVDRFDAEAVAGEPVGSKRGALRMKRIQRRQSWHQALEFELVEGARQLLERALAELAREG